MTPLSYTRILNTTIELYKQKGSLAAFEFVDQQAATVRAETANMAQLYNFRYALASASGEIETAMRLLREAIIERGYWYGPEILLEDDDLAPLRSLPEFTALVEVCRQRQTDALARARADLKVIYPQAMHSSGAHPLVMALHGNQENIRIAQGYWRSAEAVDRCILALPQSSREEFSDGYVWENIDRGVEELKEHYRRIAATFQVNADCVIFGGFSAGGGVALRAALLEQAPARGLILVAPWLPELEKWSGQMANLRARGARVFMVCGEADEDCLPGARQLEEYLEQAGVEYRACYIPGVGHEFPDDFPVILDGALCWLGERRAKV